MAYRWRWNYDRIIDLAMSALDLSKHEAQERVREIRHRYPKILDGKHTTHEMVDLLQRAA